MSIYVKEILNSPHQIRLKIMATLKKIYLKNYCGYPEIEIDFHNPEKINLALFFGENGIGKSSILYAIQTLASASRFSGRDNSLYFRKSIRHQDYDPTYSSYKPTSNEMIMHGVFDTYKGDKEVEIRMKSGEQGSGIVKNELKELGNYEYSYYVDADNPMNLQKFQINENSVDLFLEMAKELYGYECYVDKKVSEYNRETESFMNFYTDFIIYKDYMDTKVHFKRMSAGERKIATMLSYICHEDVTNKYDIILIDNWSMHIYWKRHHKLVDKFFEKFSNKQIFATDHSGVLINYLKEKYGEKHLFDIKYLLNFSKEPSEVN